MNTQKNKSQQNLLYLLEFTPNSEHILEKISVQNRLEQFLYEYLQTADIEIDSCDVMFDLVAITFYVKSSVNIDVLVFDLAQQSSDLLVQEFVEFKQFVQDGSLWSDDYTLELLS